MRHLILTIVAAASLGVFLVLPGPRQASGGGGPSPAQYQPGLWDSFKFQQTGQISSPNYDLNFSFRMKDAGTGGHLRLAFEQQDEANYYFLDIQPGKATVGKVEADFLAVLTSTEIKLPADSAVAAVVKRRQHRIAVSLNGLLVAEATDDTFTGGAAALGATSESFEVTSFRLQPVVDIFFSDDFMKGSDQQGQWEEVNGAWRIRSLDNPSLSANAFAYEGHSYGRPAVSVAGHSFWDSYDFQAAVAGPGCSTIGLIFYYQGPRDYFVFKWGPRGTVPGAPAVKQLCHIFRGKTRVIAEAPGGYLPEQWYTMRLTTQGSHLSALIDDTLVFDVYDTHAIGGKIGLYSDCTTPGCPKFARFDDVTVTGTQGLSENFDWNRFTGWDKLGGHWFLKDGQAWVQTEKVARAVTGAADWKSYSVSAEVTPHGPGWVGLVAAYLDETNYLLYRIQPSAAPEQQLLSVRDGVETVLERSSGLPDIWKAGPNRIALSLNSGVITASVNGARQLETWLGERVHGRAGLSVEGAKDAASFDNVRIAFENSRVPVRAVNPVYEHEKSMANWAAAGSDWLDLTTFNGFGMQRAYVHRMNFFGDVEFDLNVSEAENLHFMYLGLGDEKVLLKHGYHLLFDRVRPQRKAGGTETGPEEAPTISPDIHARSGWQWTASLVRNGQEVAKVELRKEISPASFRLRRTGSIIVGYVNGQPVIHFQDPQPLAVGRISYSHMGGRIDPKAIRVYSPQARCYSFRQAIVDWRTAGGVWEVTNRWQCDPRWTFFSGLNQRGLACIWNKRSFSGDVSVDFAAGVKMQRERGRRYEYARDLNVTICANGNDLTSGYSFQFGADSNRNSWIARKDKVVAQSSVNIPIHTNIHRRWFHIKVARRGKHLFYWLDDDLILEYEDPDPLTGNQVALWTWDNGIMVAEVRITSQTIGPRESPDRQVSLRPDCIYR